MRILIVGTNVRNVAESAKKAGYKVIALTKFVDEDLRLYSCKIIKINGDRKWVKKKVEEISEEEDAAVILSTGYEDLNVKAEVLGTNPDEAARIRDKLKFYRILENTGIQFPEILKENEEGIVCKPRVGGGGERTFLNRIPDLGKREFIFQKYIHGIPCSVSLIAGREITPIAVNEILAGWKEMNAKHFRYSGNITPLGVKGEERRELIKKAVETADLFDLKGSFGVDFILADKPYVLEINPRFQGSLDGVEWSYDINLFRLHMQGVEGKSIEIKKPECFAGRAILFAERDVEINSSNLTGNPFFADIPPSGSYKRDEPLISILASGHSREDVSRKILERKYRFIDYISKNKN
ncbi:MAG TPA: ATP-grasp domain-containing protein [Archaeoglobaceae archaeon]|nr:ATP-grasp domain-containing protein [Archaeoglobaceae archaeon]